MKTVFCERLGGRFTETDLKLRRVQSVRLGDKLTVAPVDTVTRNCWGITGTVELIEQRTNTWGDYRRPKTQTLTVYFVRFDEPIKRGSSAKLAGLYLPIESLIY
ncbi:MAG: hypothetical protein GY880_20800 [Planctomycetaceae bacterium]|nr:hypothetical protein [Planctomycetaceae bacterium]